LLGLQTSNDLKGQSLYLLCFMNRDSEKLENITSQEYNVLVALSHYKHGDLVALKHNTCICKFSNLEVVLNVGLVIR
jgi:hypothetical protein